MLPSEEFAVASVTSSSKSHRQSRVDLTSTVTRRASLKRGQTLVNARSKPSSGHDHADGGA